MSQSIRHPEILAIARRDGKVSVDGLSTHFGVTLQTIRRDLSDLADAGRLERVHGGAVLPSAVSNIGYVDRRQMNDAAKMRIARACAARIPNDSAIFMNIGTSTEAVAAQLGSHRNLLVVTNNMNIARILAGFPQIEVIVTGGQLRRSDGGLVGNLTVDAIRQFKCDLAVIGCSALDQDGDLLDFDIQEVAVSQTVIAQSRQVFLVADHSKFGRRAPARIGSLADIDALFTDNDLPGDLARQCRDWGTEVILT